MLDGSGLSATWIGQDQHDLAGPYPIVAVSGVQDIHISINGLDAGKTITFADVTGMGGSNWQYQGARGPWAAALVQSPGSTSADLYLEPDRLETGRPFLLQLRFDDGSTASTWFNGGVADPNLRMPSAAVQVQWVGQDGGDRVGFGPSVGPDGLQDLHLVLSNLSPTVGIDSVTLNGPPGMAWTTGVNPRALSSAELVRRGDDPSKADLYVQFNQDLAGQPFTMQVVYINGKVDQADFIAEHIEPAARVTPPLPPPATISGVSAHWLGQDGLDLTGPGDVHLAVSGLPAGRAVVGATLSNQAGSAWSFRPGGASTFYVGAYVYTLGFRRAADPTRADLSFGPVRDETGSTLTLRLALDDGTMAVVPIAGAAADPGKRAPDVASTSVVAHPGDDLNDLANRFGTVRLSPGVYDLNRPLVLAQPVRIVADPGAALLFTQGANDPPWSAAIKILKGHTTLDGFAVRFAGPVRWASGVNYGPAVIGSTDNLDNVADDLKVAISLTRLDLEAPPVLTPLEEAPRLIRLATAQNGRIEGNILKGGMVEFLNGPWQIVDNDFRGTVPNTYSYGVFAGHHTHDLVIKNNTARSVGPSGKTWRFLVLTEGGVNNQVISNNISDIGPRDDDAIASQNAPEIMLTESYSLRFEGKPAALSPDGRILQIPAPQGDVPRAGDVVAILSGPEAGQWRRIAQAINPTMLLMDAPMPRGDYLISIAGGFVDETFQGNTIDARGSSVAVDLFLAGNHFGAKVLDNHFLGGDSAFRINATPTESPVHWGWSHAPVFGLTVDGNIIEDALDGATIEVEHGPQIKTNKGRVYLSGSVTNNLVRWSDSFLARHPAPPGLTLGSQLSLDPGELVVSMGGNAIQGPSTYSQGTPLRIDAGTVNGQDLISAKYPLTSWIVPASPPPPPPSSPPTGLALVQDTGPSSVDRITRDGRLRFDPVPDAAGYEYRSGPSGPYLPVADPSAFLPLGLVQGLNTITVRAFNASGLRGPESSFGFTLDTMPPTSAEGVLAPGSDSGQSSTDRITRIAAPVFLASADPTDTVFLVRNGIVIDQRVGPGALQGPAVAVDGFYEYTLVRLDLAGNTSVSPTTGLLIDTAPPPAVPGLSATGTRVRFQSTGPTDQYVYRLGFETTYRPLWANTSFEPVGLNSGDNIVLVRAFDVAGNLGPETGVMVHVAAPTGVWLGQDGRDLVSRSPLLAPDGFQDVHIRIRGIPANRTIAYATIQGLGADEWQYRGVWGPWPIVLARASGATTADLYIAPARRETGRPFLVVLRYDDGGQTFFWVRGGRADPNLRVPFARRIQAVIRPSPARPAVRTAPTRAVLLRPLPAPGGRVLPPVRRSLPPHPVGPRNR